jgi:hypothetical protein
MAAWRTTMWLSISENKTSAMASIKRVHSRYKEERLNSLKHKIRLNNIQESSSHMTGNAVHLCYKEQTGRLLYYLDRAATASFKASLF